MANTRISWTLCCSPSIRWRTRNSGIRNSSRDAASRSTTSGTIRKSHAIDELLKHIDGKIEDTIAFGDAKIDIPMFEYCAVGVAMGNGGEEIKAMADFVTDAVAEDGLFHAFQRLGLI